MNLEVIDVKDSVIHAPHEFIVTIGEHDLSQGNFYCLEVDQESASARLVLVHSEQLSAQNRLVIVPLSCRYGAFTY